MADLTSHEAAAHESHALPVMLPPGKLVGRDAILAQVYSHLKENKAVLVYGASGIGKTALAATLARAYTELPGGVLWLNVDDTPFPELLARIGRAYNIKELATSDNPISLVASAINTLVANKPLVVLDGRVNTQAASELAMRCADKLPILLVNQQQIAGPWTAVALDKLETPAAAAMFTHLVPDQTEGLDDLLAALGGIPLAVIVAAGAVRAKQQSPAEFLAALPKRAEVPPPLLALTAAFGTLSSALQGLLLLMGATFRGEASPELFSLIAGAPEATITQALNGLAQQHLVERVERYGKPYYRLHPLTYTFAQSWLRGSGRLDGLQAKIRDAMLTYAHQFSAAPDRLAAEMDNFLAVSQWAADANDREVANQFALTLMQASDFVNARGYVYELLLLRRLAASSTNAFPAYSEAPTPLPFAEGDEDDEDDTGESEPFESDLVDEDDEDEDLIEDEAEVVDEVIDEETEADEEEDVLHRLSPVPVTSMPVAPAEEEDEDEEEDFDDELDLIGDEEDFEESESLEDSEPVSPPESTDELVRLRAALVQARQSGNRRQQAELLSSIGKELTQRGQQTEAISSYAEAVNAYEVLDDQPGLLTTLEVLADLAVKTENSQAAVLHAARGVELAEDLGNETSQRKLLTILGDARQQLGESDEAIQTYSEALDLARTADDQRSAAVILYKLGYAQLDSGAPNDAMKTWEDALTAFREQGRRDYEGRALAGLGTASGELERWSEATRFYNSALHIAREIKDSDEELLRLVDLGYAAVQTHQLGQAVLRYRQALHLAFASQNRENVVSTTVDLGRLLVESQRHLDITELLVDAALKYDPNDRDLKRLTERIQDEREVLAPEIQQVPVGGTAQEYAANAYSLLENS